MKAAGVEYVFGIISIHNIPIYDAIARQGGIRTITNHSEPGAVNMAEGFAKATGTLGVVITSTGAGADNAAGSLIEAQTNGTPLLHITGQVDSPYLDQAKGFVHECKDQLGMLKAISKEAFRVRSIGSLATTVQNALEVAQTAPTGIVSVEIPIDIQKMLPKRGKEALDAIGILEGFEGVSVHDGWRSYWQYACQHTLCNEHHLRELTFLDEEHQQDWAGRMKTLLLDIKAAVKQARAEGRTSLHPPDMADWKAQYAVLLAEGFRANPPDRPPEAGKRGRRKQSAARNLLDRLSTHQEAVLLFLDTFAVPFDNSLAERDIRMVKVQQKISGCFHSPASAVAFCRIRGYLSTVPKQALAVLTALEQALVGHPVSPAF